MLQRPDHKVLSALASLEGDANFQTVLHWLEGSLQDLYESSCYTKDEVLSRWQQGAAQAVGDLLNKTKEARTVMHKSR